jgi:hypothetical protein
MKKMDADQRCRQIAAERHGVISRGEAYENGHDSRSIATRVKSGEWKELYPNAFGIGGDESWSRNLAGACVSAKGAAFRRSAAALQKFPGIRPRELEVITTCRIRPLLSVDVHHTCYLPEDHLTMADGLPTTSPARTLFDMSGICGFRWTRGLTLALLEKDLVTPTELHELLGHTARSGRPGSAIFRRVIADLGIDHPIPASFLEDRAYEVIVAAGFPAPIRQFDVRVGGVFLGRPDLGYPSLGICIEADGWDSHRSKIRFLDDRARQNGLVSHGWIVLRFTARDAERPLRFLIELERAIERARRLIAAGIRPAV